MAYLYKIENVVNNKTYIGSTNNIKTRWGKHRYELRTNTHKNTYLQNAWNKYGEEKFKFDILMEVDDDEQFKKEQELLDDLKPYPPIGYNISHNAFYGGYYSGIKRSCKKGEKHPNSVITKEVAEQIKRKLASGETVSKISKELGVSPGLISGIKHLRSWVDIGKEYNEKLEGLKKPIINEEILQVVHKLKEENTKWDDIVEKMGVARYPLVKAYKFYVAQLNNKISACECCGEKIIKNSNTQKYCKSCAKKMKNKKVAEIKKRRRLEKKNNKN